MADDAPLVTSVISTTPSTIIRRYNNEDPLHTLARVWPCSACGCLLGIVHLVLGITILTFDILTNHVTGTAFATIAALSYLVCSILCFIAVRRLDRGAQLLLFAFSFFASIASLAIFLESAAILNQTCTPISCDQILMPEYSILIVISLTEWVTCIATMMVCYRSLRNAFGVANPSSPYSTLITGDYRILQKQPRIADPRYSTLYSRTVLQ